MNEVQRREAHPHVCGGETPIVVAYLHLVAPLPKKSRDTGIDISSVCCCWVHSSARLSRQVLYDSNKPDATCSRRFQGFLGRLWGGGGRRLLKRHPKVPHTPITILFYQPGLWARQTQKVTRKPDENVKVGANKRGNNYTHGAGSAPKSQGRDEPCLYWSFPTVWRRRRRGSLVLLGDKHTPDTVAVEGILLK